jgi:DNA-binding LacI/PurR family transcriptional regulator
MEKRRLAAKAGTRRRPTQADVALLAGVSPAIVSAVINNRPAGTIRVSEATHERVREAVRHLGYVPNVAARNLARGRNHILGIFSYEPVFPRESVNFYREFLVGIEEQAETCGYNLLMFSAAKNREGIRSIYANEVNALQLADASILVGANERHDEIIRLANEHYPFVMIGRRVIPGIEPSYVAADYASATRDAVRALVELGHRSIAFVHGTSQHESAIDRRAGFTQAQTELQLDPANAPCRPLHDERDAQPLCAELVANNITAIVTESTTIAGAFKRAARGLGIAIPQRLSLISHEDSEQHEKPDRLATIRIPRPEIGRKAVELLLQLIDDPTAAPLQCQLPCDLKLTRTIGPPPTLPDETATGRFP